jgi:hypothetical protein
MDAVGSPRPLVMTDCIAGEASARRFADEVRDLIR